MLLNIISKKLMGMTLTLSTLSYWICLFACLTCLLLTQAGSNKAKPGISGSVIIYTVIQCVFSVLK